MSIYNQYTINANIAATPIECDEENHKTIWKIELLADINNLGRADGKPLKSGSTFRYISEENADDDEVIDYIRSHGILDSCNITDPDFEYTYLSQSS